MTNLFASYIDLGPSVGTSLLLVVGPVVLILAFYVLRWTLACPSRTFVASVLLFLGSAVLLPFVAGNAILVPLYLSVPCMVGATVRMCRRTVR